jgi:hypothetical protein
MPAKAGIQSTRYRISWIPAFAGMTAYIAINFPTIQLNRRLFMKEIDARGLACPAPVLQTKATLQEEKPGSVKVIVDKVISI